MNDDKPTTHESTGATTDERRPSHPESARSLIAAASRGVLSTLDRRDGSPYGSLAEHVAGADGDVIFLLSGLADHTANFKEDRRASFFVSPQMAHGRPLALERATLVGQIRRVEDAQACRQLYLGTHPHAARYVDFSDFAFWRLCVERVRYIGGFGRMSWVDGSAYAGAEPDPLVEIADGAIEHMNDDHGQALVDYARAFGGVDELDSARMVGLDRLGFDLSITDASGRQQQVRIHFDEPLEDPSAVRPTMVELVERARSVLAERD
jgi:heme iron utilization protein